MESRSFLLFSYIYNHQRFRYSQRAPLPLQTTKPPRCCVEFQCPRMIASLSRNVGRQVAALCASASAPGTYPRFHHGSAKMLIPRVVQSEDFFFRQVRKPVNFQSGLLRLIAIDLSYRRSCLTPKAAPTRTYWPIWRRRRRLLSTRCWSTRNAMPSSSMNLDSP